MILKSKSPGKNRIIGCGLKYTRNEYEASRDRYLSSSVPDKPSIKLKGSPLQTTNQPFLQKNILHSAVTSIYL